MPTSPESRIVFGSSATSRGKEASPDPEKFTTLEKKVPFSDVVSILAKDTQLKQRAEAAKKQGVVAPNSDIIIPPDLSQAYLRWLWVRRVEFQDGTGWEGYPYPGFSFDNAAKVINIGQDLLKMLTTQYGRDAATKRRVLHALYKETYDTEALMFWNSAFGTEIAKLRSFFNKMYSDNYFLRFRSNTAAKVATLPPVSASIREDGVYQRYTLKKYVNQPKKEDVGSDEQMVAQEIGKMGAPMTRWALTQLTR